MKSLKLDSICFLIKVTLPSACQVHWALTPGYGSFAGAGGRAAHPFSNYPENGGEGGWLWSTGAQKQEMWSLSLPVPCQQCGFGQADCFLLKEVVRSDILLKVEELSVKCCLSGRWGGELAFQPVMSGPWGSQVSVLQAEPFSFVSPRLARGLDPHLAIRRFGACRKSASLHLANQKGL